MEHASQYEHGYDPAELVTASELLYALRLFGYGFVFCGTLAVILLARLS
jgi:hypothetical protein